MEHWYIEFERERVTQWEYYNSTDNDPGTVYTEWKNFNIQYLHFYYHKPLLF